MVLTTIMGFLFRIHFPDIALADTARRDIFHGRHGRQHGMVLVVVPVHAVPTDEEKIVD
jgi:hypothetical protein